MEGIEVVQFFSTSVLVAVSHRSGDCYFHTFFGFVFYSNQKYVIGFISTLFSQPLYEGLKCSFEVYDVSRILTTLLKTTSIILV